MATIQLPFFDQKEQGHLRERLLFKSETPTHKDTAEEHLKGKVMNLFKFEQLNAALWS